MIYELPLQAAGLAAGLLLIFTHAFALWRPAQAGSWATSFPRARVAAGVLLAAAAIWSFLLVRDIDLGEFSPLRNVMLMAIAVGAVLAWMYVEEFLAVRALGMVLLLAAEPLLESAALRDEPSRLLLVVLAYAWVVAGLFFVGMPYLLRDLIDWTNIQPWRWKAGCSAGLAYGAALVICALFFW